MWNKWIFYTQLNKGTENGKGNRKSSQRKKKSSTNYRFPIFMLFGFWRAQERRLSPLDRKWSSSSRSGSRSAEKRLEDDLENDFSAIIPRRPELLWRWRHRLTIWTALPKLKTSFPRYTGLFCNRLRRIRGWWCRSLTPAGPIVNSFANPPLCCLARSACVRKITQLEKKLRFSKQIMRLEFVWQLELRKLMPEAQIWK